MAKRKASNRLLAQRLNKSELQAKRWARVLMFTVIIISLFTQTIYYSGSNCVIHLSSAENKIAFFPHFPIAHIVLSSFNAYEVHAYTHFSAFIDIPARLNSKRQMSFFSFSVSFLTLFSRSPRKVFSFTWLPQNPQNTRENLPKKSWLVYSKVRTRKDSIEKTLFKCFFVECFGYVWFDFHNM